MGKIRVLRGLPGSGKTTEARKIVEESGNAGRINRDDLRAMLFNGKWSGKREGIVIEAERALAQVLISHNHTAIIDDTNLTDKHWRLWTEFAKEIELENPITVTQTTMTTPLAVCVQRDAQRTKPVGEAVINRMALNAGWIQFPDRPIVLVDIDGTLADGEHREHLVKGPKKDWDAYYKLLSADFPHEHIVKWVYHLSENHTIVIVSGRPDTYQRETLFWLREVAKVPFDWLFMRAGSDKREDSIVKKEILDKIPKEKIAFVIDDRPRVIRMWRENGLSVIPVKGQCDEF